MGPQYKYRPLQENEFRLISLQPGRWDDDIRIELETYPADTPRVPFYAAISCVLGDATERQIAVCEGNWIALHSSAVSVMRRLRYLRHKRLIWINAVCINQGDPLEKNAQAKIIGSIYQRADRVLIYLGEADDSSDRAMDSIAARRPAAEGSAEVHAVLNLFRSRAWFTCVWVLQEVALADCALVVCGSKCVSWACFPAWWARNAAHAERILDQPPTLFYSPGFLKRPSLLQQLHSTRRSRATDPRDKIFALLGLLSPEEARGISVDYSQTFSRACINAAISILQPRKTLLLLSAVEDRDSGHRDFSCDLPSWVPNWTVDPNTASLGLASQFLEPYDAGGKPAADTEIRYPDAEDKPVLSCPGLCLGVVAELGARCPVKANENEVAKVLSEWSGLLETSADGGGPGRAPATAGQGSRGAGGGVVHGKGMFFPTDAAACRLWPIILAQPTRTVELRDEAEEEAAQKIQPADVDALKFCFGRRLLSARHPDPGDEREPPAFFGLGPASARPGDVIAVLLGAPVPHVLRPLPRTRQRQHLHYALVGECYIHGVMGGEALAHLGDELRERDHRHRPFPQSVSSSPLGRFDIV